jgi:hypothetical protein
MVVVAAKLARSRGIALPGGSAGEPRSAWSRGSGDPVTEPIPPAVQQQESR